MSLTERSPSRRAPPVAHPQARCRGWMQASPAAGAAARQAWTTRGSRPDRSRFDHPNSSRRTRNAPRVVWPVAAHGKRYAAMAAIFFRAQRAKVRNRRAVAVGLNRAAVKPPHAKHLRSPARGGNLTEAAATNPRATAITFPKRQATEGAQTRCAPRSACRTPVNAAPGARHISKRMDALAAR